jgi:Flp pilus assembly protein TadG
MDRRGYLPVRRRPETGATLVEFALVAPVLFMLIFGLMAGSFLVYQSSALHDGATAGARMASIEVNSTATLVNSSLCESGQPGTIETAVSQATPLLTVNTAPLCESGPNQLTQSNVNGDVNIIVNCGGPGGCASPDNVQVQLVLATQGLVAPIGGTYHLTASSTDPTATP